MKQFTRLRTTSAVYSVLKFLAKPANFFVLISLVSGITLSIILPPFSGMDEAAHVYRVYQLSSGDLFMEQKDQEGYGHPIPDALHRVNIKAFSLKNESISNRYEEYTKAGSYMANDSVSFQRFEGSGSYSPIGYINYMPISVFARLVTNNMFAYILVLRIVGLLISIAMVYLSIRLMPFGKWFFVSIGLLPMSIHQMATVSMDGLILSAILLFIALCLSSNTPPVRDLLRSRRRNRYIYLVSLLVLASIIATKPVYTPVMLFMFFIPDDLYGSTRRKLITIGSILALAISSLFLWYGSLAYIGQSTAVKHFFETVNKQALESPTTLFKDVLKNPEIVPMRVVNTFFIQNETTYPLATFQDNYFPSFFFNTFIGVFGSLNVYPPTWLSISVVGSLLLGFIVEKRNKLKIRWRILALNELLAILCLTLLIAIFWLTWTSRDSIVVFGLQGRYIIPILPLLVMSIPSKDLLNVKKRGVLLLFASLVMINSLAMISTVWNYYYA